MHIFSWIAWTLPLLALAPADVDRQKLGALSRLPETNLAFGFSYNEQEGFVLSCGPGPVYTTPDTLRKTLKGDDSDAQTYSKIGDLLTVAAKPAEAADAWEKSVALDRHALISTPADPVRLARIAQSLHQLRKKADRDAAIAEAAARAPKSASVQDTLSLLRMADALEVLTGHMVNLSQVVAPPTLEAAIREKPAPELIARSLRALEEAKAFYDRAVSVEPDRSRAYAERTILRAAYAFDTGLLKTFERNRAITPEELAKAEADYGRALFFPESVSDIVKAADLSPDDPFAIGMAAFFSMFSEIFAKSPPPDVTKGGGLLLLSAENRKTVDSLLARLDKLSHSDNRDLAERAALALGAVQMYAVTTDEGIRTLRRAESLNPSDPRATELLLASYFAAKDLPGMRKTLEDGLKHDDTVRWRLLLAKVAAKENDWKRAELETRSALRDDPQSFDANLALCAVLLHSARTDAEVVAAGEQCMQTQKIAPPTPTPEQYFAFNFLSAIFEAMEGMNAEARARIGDLRGHIESDQSEDVKALLAQLPLM